MRVDGPELAELAQQVLRRVGEEVTLSGHLKPITWRQVLVALAGLLYLIQEVLVVLEVFECRILNIF